MNYNPAEIKLFKRLSTPAKIQDYLNGLKFNFEKQGETCYSPRMVIKNKTAHCMEGAMFAAAALDFCGARPWVVDLRSIKPQDDDHVIAVFKQFNCFGAISKTNHGVLRYREPVYKTLRELIMSYFHEYFLNTGQKTLREYSDLVDLKIFDYLDWRTSKEHLFAIPQKLDKVKHHKILLPQQIKNLRPADKIEIQTGKITEYK
ncbi:MAG: hypothetical protein WC794_04710 [Candidatus Doudnabacteria bacterium]|jgi:hypothetical protein